MITKHVLLALPTYDGTRHNGLHLARALRKPPEGVLVNAIEASGSVLTYTFNTLWCAALNLRESEKPVTHFLMWHADVLPLGDDWIEKMLTEMERLDAKVLSAVIPIKNDTGMTSTAESTEDDYNSFRYTQAQVNEQPKGSWTTPTLLINTGLLLVDFTQPWVEKICFTMKDKIVYEDGKYKPRFVPEDWDFSRQCRALGVHVHATTCVAVDHVGRSAYRSVDTWGFPTDAEFRAKTER